MNKFIKNNINNNIEEDKIKNIFFKTNNNIRK